MHFLCWQKIVASIEIVAETMEVLHAWLLPPLAPAPLCEQSCSAAQPQSSLNAPRAALLQELSRMGSASKEKAAELCQKYLENIRVSWWQPCPIRRVQLA